MVKNASPNDVQIDFTEKTVRILKKPFISHAVCFKITCRLINIYSERLRENKLVNILLVQMGLLNGICIYK